MPKGRVLTTAEREEITRLHAGGASAREIGKQLSRSKTVVLNFLKAPAQYAQTKRSGRKRALSGDDERRLHAALVQRLAFAGGASGGSPRPDAKRSAEQIRREFNVPLSTRRIQQLLSEWRREARRAQDRQQQEPTMTTLLEDENASAAAAPAAASKNVASTHAADANAPMAAVPAEM
ncbi:hypothetical protein PybrP1_004776 [[Pythium] brassicae (nom. inval.)]|nr:hypothetical protein PybrP1_004776 [[Pythium] brassicae (nom. inval.)]